MLLCLQTEKPGWLQSVGSQTVGHDWVINTHTHTRVNHLFTISCKIKYLVFHYGDNRKLKLIPTLEAHPNPGGRGHFALFVIDCRTSQPWGRCEDQQVDSWGSWTQKKVLLPPQESSITHQAETTFLSVGIPESSPEGPNVWDLMPDDLRWSWCNHNRNIVHNKCNVLESSPNHSQIPVCGKTVFQETGPWCKKGKTAGVT